VATSRKGGAVTLNELLALLGRAWSRLLLFPGGLAAFAAVCVIAYLWSQRPTRTEGRAPRSEAEPARSANQEAETFAGSWFLVVGSIAPPWLALALLPLPPAAGLSRQIDLIVALALLEAPLLLAVARELGKRDVARRTDVWRLAAALNGYPVLILSGLALAQAAGSFGIAALARVPGDLAPAFARPLHWIGAAGLALALPPLLGIGPFGAPSPLNKRSLLGRGGWEVKGEKLRARFAAVTRAVGVDPIQIGLWLRTLGLVLLAALPWMGAFGALDEGGLRTVRGFAAWLLAPLALAALLWAYSRLAAGHSALAWARAYLVLDAALLLALLWAAYQALQARLA
jgi:hypothetical protein